MNKAKDQGAVDLFAPICPGVSLFLERLQRGSRWRGWKIAIIAAFLLKATFALIRKSNKKV